MAVRLYIHKQADVHNIVQGDSLDAVAKRTIIARLQSALSENVGFYAVILADGGAQTRTALLPDLLIISGYGIGFVDLCHESGSIFRSENVWYANGKMIQGNIHTGAHNPHDQIQRCAEYVRNALMTPPREDKPWLPGRYITWQDLMFDTTVCFTDPEADYQHIVGNEPMKDWERFSACDLKQLSHRVTQLAFAQSQEDRDSVMSFRLREPQILRIVENLFSAKHLPPLVESHTSSPHYGYLLLKHDGDLVAQFVLDHEQMTLGREPSCDVIVPQRYRLVSRIHANLMCSGDEVTIVDLSRNGTFINSTRVKTPTRLLPGQQILLGGNQLVDGVCLLEFAQHAVLLGQNSSSQASL
jgi:hypothetical protein